MTTQQINDLMRDMIAANRLTMNDLLAIAASNTLPHEATRRDVIATVLINAAARR